MTRLFHLTAAAALIALGVIAAHPTTARVRDPRAELSRLTKAAGLVYQDSQPVAGAGTLLSFKELGCASDVDILYMPGLSRIGGAAEDEIDASGRKATFIYDGAVIPAIGPSNLMPRWAWRKLLVATDLKTAEPWQSIALALLVPRGCAPPHLDWATLRRGGI
jgi:hypothetical protein